MANANPVHITFGLANIRTACAVLPFVYIALVEDVILSILCPHP
jgi:hypothetical protein